MHSPKVLAQSRRNIRRHTNRCAIMMLMLENLESRVMLAGTPTQLLFAVQPSQTAVGTPIYPAIQVAVADPTGATVTTDTSTVVLSVISGPFGGSLTVGGTASLTASVKAVSGIATFSNISFTATGTYELAVNDGSLAGTASNLFSVTAAAAKLAFIQQPLDISAGTPFSPAIRVWVEDAGGNQVTSDHSSVKLSIVTGPAGGVLTGTTTVNAALGEAVFNGVSLSKPGQYRLQVTDGSLTLAQSNLVTVSAGAPAMLVFQQALVNTPANTTLAPVIVDVTDASGNIVTTDSSAVTLSINTGPIGGGITGTATVNAVNGVATFSDLSFAQIGVYTLGAADGALTAAISNVFPITGPAAKLGFVRLPVQTTMGTVMTPGIQVAVEDVNGFAVPGDTSNVTIAIGTGPAGATMSGTTTVAAVNGVATFSNLTFSNMGTYTVTVSDGLLTGATSSPFIINGTATQLAFLVQPAAPSANTAITPPVVVVVEDILGNRVVNSAAIVTISLHSGPGVLSGVTQMTAVNGSASFSNLKLSLAGTYTLAAAAAGLTGVLSNSFVVLPAASQLVFLAQPTSVAQGSAMFPAVTVQIQDTLGHLATTNTSSVTLAITGGPRNGSMSGTTTVAAVAGVATFANLSFSVPGGYSLVATDGALATALSNRFTVTAPAARLQWAGEPAPTVTAGTSGAWMPAMTVWVEDRNKEPVPAHVVMTLTISTGPTGATIVGSATASALNGKATFGTVALPVAGAYVLTVSSTGLTAALSKRFNVVADKATAHLVVAQSPATTLVGRTFSSKVVIDVADALGNIIKSSTSAITLALASGPGGTLHGTTTHHASNGVATFSNLSIDMAGSYVLDVSTPSLPGTASFATTISPVTTLANKPASHASNYAVGQAFTVTASLKGLVSSPVAWTGTAMLVDAASHVLSGPTAVSAKGQVTFPVAGQTTAGTEMLHVIYSGDVNHLGASSPTLTLTVGPATATKVTPSAKKIASGTTLNLDVLVSSGHTPLVRTGTVQLVENGSVLSSLSLDGNSHALFSLVPAVGSHSYTVNYLGDINFRSSVSSVVKITVV